MILNIELLSEIRTDIVGTNITKATSENPDIATNINKLFLYNSLKKKKDFKYCLIS